MYLKDKLRKHLKQILLTVILCLCAGFSSGGSTFKASKVSTHGFIENRGQIIDQDNNPNPDVKYLFNTPGFNVQLRKVGFSYDVYAVKSFNTPHSVLNSISGRRNQIDSAIKEYQFHRIDFDLIGANQIDSAIKEYQFHRIDFDLIGANLKCEVVESNPSKEYYNYYTTGTPVAGVTHVRSYQRITYKNIYPGIDLELMLMVRPGKTAIWIF